MVVTPNDSAVVAASHCISYDNIVEPPVAVPLSAVMSTTSCDWEVSVFLNGATGGFEGAYSI